MFRGFFGVPGAHHRGDCRRDPFFDAMTHDDDEDEDDEGAFYYSDHQGDQQDTLDDAFRFGFSFGPSGIRIQESPVFGHVFREMEEIFSQLGRWEGQAGPGHFGGPSIMPPPPQDRPGHSHGESSGNVLRDFMLKRPLQEGPPSPGEPGSDDTPPSGAPHFPRSPFQDWTPKFRHSDIWRGGPQRAPETREDTDLDSAVSSGGLDQVLDQILTPPPTEPPNQPKIRSFFQSVTVSKVVKPDGTVEERRTVRDGQGNEETTVTRSGGPGSLKQSHYHIGLLVPDGETPFSDMRDDGSFFSKFFRGFK